MNQLGFYYARVGRTIGVQFPGGWRVIVVLPRFDFSRFDKP